MNIDFTWLYKFFTYSSIQVKFIATFIAIFVSAPIGLLSAIYLSEYAKPKFRKYVKPLIEILAGIGVALFAGLNGYIESLVFLVPSRILKDENEKKDLICLFREYLQIARSRGCFFRPYKD